MPPLAMLCVTEPSSQKRTDADSPSRPQVELIVGEQKRELMLAHLYTSH